MLTREILSQFKNYRPCMALGTEHGLLEDSIRESDFPFAHEPPRFCMKAVFRILPRVFYNQSQSLLTFLA
jgi:hypothetical protein